MCLLAEVKNDADPGTATIAVRTAPAFMEATELFMANHGPKLKPRLSVGRTASPMA